MRNYNLIDSQGNVYRGKNLKEFCRQRNLRYSTFVLLNNGQRESAEGFYTLSHRKSKKKREKYCINLINMQSGDKIRVTMPINKFAKDHDMCDRFLSELINGKRVAYKHWVTENTYNKISAAYLTDLFKNT